MRVELLVIRTVTPKAHREYVLGDTLERVAELVEASGERQAAQWRMALGAAPRAINRLVLIEGMRPVLVGLLLGLGAALSVNRVLQSQLVGISPYDALTLTLTPMALVTVALLGCLLPLRQAAHVDPASIMRDA